MRRQILTAIVGVTVIAVVILTVPLAIIIARREAASSTLELQRVAQRTAALLPSDPLVDASAIQLPESEPGLAIGIYAPDGSLLKGSGPERADQLTRSARAIERNGTVGTYRVFASPVMVDRRLTAIVRVAEPLAESNSRTRKDMALIAMFDVAAVAGAALIGSVVSRRLTRPLSILRDDAVRLGLGDFAVGTRHSGISEIDQTSRALSETATRLGRVLDRERAFSADASHQLRTPLAALRLSVETEMLYPRPQPVEVFEEVMEQVERLEETIGTLLEVARDRPPPRKLLDPHEIARELHRNWGQRLLQKGRRLRTSAASSLHVHVSVAVLRQVLEILVHNSVEHGEGDVEVDFDRGGAGGLIVTVSDEGHLKRPTEGLFTRWDPGATDHGVGLNLARSLCEAEGGRLTLSATEPTTFTVILPDSDQQQNL